MNKILSQITIQVNDKVYLKNPDYEYPHMLVSTIIEGAHHQRYFAEHLPRLTDFEKGKDLIMEFYKQMVFKTIVT